MKINLIILLLGASVQLVAQTPGAVYEQEYTRGVSQLQRGEFSTAYSSFSALSRISQTNHLLPYAYYYMAVSGLRINRIAESKNAIVELLNRFPAWPKIDEAKYLLADCYFKEKKYSEALALLQTINNKNLTTDIESLKRFNISPIIDIDLLKTLAQQFPAELVIAEKLTAVTANIKTMPKYAGNLNKGYYNISFLMPFRMTEYQNDPKNIVNQYVYDMYLGMKMAVAKLQKEGISINLQAIDLANSKDDASKLLANPLFLQSDMFFGPVYNEPAKIISDYCEYNKLFMINPVSITKEIVNNKQYSLLSQPSLDYQAQYALDWMSSMSAMAATNKKVAIYVGATRRDTMLANLYKNKAIARGFLVIDYRKIREKLDSTASISERNKPDHVVVFSNNDHDGVKVLNMMTKKRVHVPIMANQESFDLMGESNSIFNDKNVFLINNQYIDHTKPAAREFESQFLLKQNIIPSNFSVQGYDMMLYFGRALHKNKDKIRDGINKLSFDNDMIGNGFDFSLSNENKRVNIIKMENMQWIAVE